MMGRGEVVFSLETKKRGGFPLSAMLLKIRTASLCSRKIGH
jgi:hypothetical protein